MAGKQHHHVWRMLQRGFGDKKGADHHIWVYHKGVIPSRKGTRNFGADRFFYGPEGSETDESITKFENSVQGKIQDARVLDDGEELSAMFVAPLIAHLESRSNFLRAELSSLLERIQFVLGDHFSSTAKLKTMARDYLKRNPEQINELLATNFVPNSQRELLSKQIEVYFDHLPTEVFESLLDGMVAEAFLLAKLLPDVVKESHNKAILEIKSESPRVKALLEFKYTVYRPQVGQLILPDTCCAFIGLKDCTPFAQPQNAVHTIIVPISSEVAIVGRKGKEWPLELKTVNRLLAGCAHDAFIARTNDPVLASLSGRIGKYAKLIGDKEIRELLSFENLLSK
ncbi:hypothetical protein GG681_12045 [Epibacterium sp. SM1969]|uniref:DUF4238 domain-containing protein n=1 Tax=Tritonibacter aquimaris TaxID=2663379 RepID=A0A844B1W2_9RHOB|nr:hypothetical protein [Tritonibacter aquimaris]MQY43376.1 hypothetical protein [Tritonibacter aquimaris]